MKVRAANDLTRAFERATKARANALTMTADPTGLFVANQKQIVELAAKKRLPSIYTSSTYVNAGGLMSYAPNELQNHRRAAIYVDKILKGAKPADLPVDQPTKFEKSQDGEGDRRDDSAIGAVSRGPRDQVRKHNGRTR